MLTTSVLAKRLQLRLPAAALLDLRAICVCSRQDAARVPFERRDVHHTARCVHCSSPFAMRMWATGTYR